MNERNSAEVCELINKYMLFDETLMNMTTIMIPRKSFYLPDKTTDEFFDVYNELIKDPNFYCSFTQKPDNTSMLVVDVDLQKEIDDENDIHKLYNENDVIELITLYFNELSEYINKQFLSCLILTKKPYIKYKGSKIFVKHGFHLAFPKVFLTLDKRVYIRQKVQQQTKYILDDIETKLWLLYGSRKSRDTGVYKISNILEYDNDGDLLLHKDLRNYKKNYQCFNRDEQLIPTTTVRMMNIWVEYRTKYVFNFTIKINVVKEIEYKISDEKDEIIQEAIPFENLKMIIEKFTYKLSDDFKSWFAIGDAIHNITKGSEQGFELWCEFSEKSEKYDYNECKRVWNRFKDVHTFGTIEYYFRRR